MTSISLVTIRPFTSADYEAVCAVTNAAYPDYPETPDEQRHQDQTRNPGLRWARWVAVADEQMVGYASFTQAHVETPHKFGIDAVVLPDWRGQGIGKALYETLYATVLPHTPESFRTHAHEPAVRGQRFLQDRGFREVQREQESLLDLDTWSPAAWQNDSARVTNDGIIIKTYAELKAAAEDSAALHREINDLHWALKQDIPSSAPPVREPHEDFLTRFTRPDFLPEGNVFALDGHQLVGESVLWYASASNEMFTGTTGVLRAYRKRGIATALKIAALTYAKAYGATGVRTFNEVNNRAMLGINHRLGFVPLPAWIEYRKTFDKAGNVE